jgi:serine/threonine protein kinase
VLAGLEAIFRTQNDRGHALDLVHGCLGPQSIVVGVDGRTRIADLGLQSVRRGNAHYDAPEVLLGEACTQRADIFSVGMILYEMLRGSHPLANVSGEELLRRSREPLPLLSVQDPSIPPSLAEVAARALALDPALRYRSAEAFTAALERACPPASFREVAAFVTMNLGEAVEAKRTLSSEWVRAHAAALGEETPSMIARARRRARLLLIRRRRQIWALAVASVIALWVLLGALVLRG